MGSEGGGKVPVKVQGQTGSQGQGQGGRGYLTDASVGTGSVACRLCEH